MSEYRKFRQIQPIGDQKLISEYDIEGAELQNLLQQNPDILYTTQLDLSSARSVKDPMQINVSGRGAVIYGYSLTSKYDPITNTGIEVSEPSAFVNARVNADRAENAMHMKHNRGFRGTFGKLFLSWPAQENVGAFLVVFKADAQPWITGESDNRFNSVEASNNEAQSAVTVTNTAGVIVPQNLSRKCATIYVSGATTIFVGDSAVTAATGIPLLQTNVLFWRNTSALYGITASGSNTDVRVLEEW